MCVRVVLHFCAPSFCVIGLSASASFIFTFSNVFWFTFCTFERQVELNLLKSLQYGASI